MPNNNIITIDGPCASGKGTVAKRIAQSLGWHYLDSGALYRLSALYVIRQNISLNNEKQIADAVLNLPVRFTEDDIFLESQKVTDIIRTEEIGNYASKIAVYPQLRHALLQRQRDFAQFPGLIADGRDMGNVIFPEATLKIFLTASAQVRAMRRVNQLKNMGKIADYDTILADIQARDLSDTQRKEAPLTIPEHAYKLDTSQLSIDEAVKTILNWYEKIKV